MIQIILLSFIIILVIFFIKNRELFINFRFYNNKYLSKTEACQVIDNELDISDYNDMDFKLRNINIENKNTHYCDRLLDFLPADKKLLDWVMEIITKKTPNKLRFLFNNITYGKYEMNVENNFPHTHGNTIFLTDKFISGILYYLNNNLEEDMIRDIGVIIIHECIHLWQRKDTKLFYKLYIYYWNFIKVKKIHNNYFVDRVRYNPDGVDLNWVLSIKNKNILLLSVYKKNSKHIGHVDTIGVFLKKEGISYIVPDHSEVEIKQLNKIKEYNYLFENINGNNYHPNELSAELISIYYMKLMGISHKNFNNRALDQINKWFENDVYKKY